MLTFLFFEQAPDAAPSGPRRLATGCTNHASRFEVSDLFLSCGLSLGKRARIVRIADRDPEPRVAAEDLAVEEPPTDQTVSVVLQLARPSGRTVRLVVATVPGMRTGSDYAAFRRVIEVPPGTTRVEAPVTILADLEIEPDETFVVRIERARFARIRTADAVVTIAAQTPPPPPEGAGRTSGRR